MRVIDEKNIEKVKRLIKKSGNKPIIVLAQDDGFNRKILEYGKFDVLLGVENGSGESRKGSLRQIDSGLNHVLARTASRMSVRIGVDAREIAGLGKLEKAERLTKIRQNIEICRKVGCKFAVLNYKDEKDAFGFLVSLGASSKQAKEAISF